MACEFYCPRHYGLTMNAVKDFVQQRSFVDVKLVCKNKKTVYAHKLILASVSPFLKAVIEEGNNVDDMATVFLPDFDYNIVTLLLTFLCEGFMKLTREELEEFRELCNGLGMSFSGSVKVLNESHYSQSSSIQQAADIAVNPSADTQRRIFTEKSSSYVSSRDTLPAPSKVPDSAKKDSVVASIVPKIEDCEECQNFGVAQPVPGNDFQNTSQMLDVKNTQQSLTDSNFSEAEKHRQMSLDTGENVMYSDAAFAGSWKKLKRSHSDTQEDSYLWHTPSSPAQELPQHNEMSHMHSIAVLPMPVEQYNFQSTNSQFAHQESTSQQIVKQSKTQTENSCNGSDMKSTPVISRSAEQVHFYTTNTGSVDATSSSSQNKEMSQMHSIPSVPMSFERDNFHSGESVENQTKSSHSKGDMYSVSSSVSAEQSAYQEMQKQLKAKTKKLHNGTGVQKKHLIHNLNSSSVNKKLPEQTGTISHKMKQSTHLKCSDKQSDLKVSSKRQSVEKSAQPKKRKKSEGTVRSTLQLEVTMYCVKAHCGIPTSGTADKLANAAICHLT